MVCFMARLNSCRSLRPAVPPPVVTAILAFKEVASIARNGSPVWISNKRLNLDEYYSRCFPWYARNVPRFVHEASKASALIPVDASLLVENIMNPAHYQKIFPSIIGEVSKVAPHLKCQMINVDFMLQICPFIQSRNVKVIRCTKQVEPNSWVIADISMYFSSYAPPLRPGVMRFPSGYLIQHISNGLCKVTVIEHWVYREERVMNPCPSNPNSTDAMKWLNALQRHYCYNNCLTPIPSIGPHVQIFDPICQTNLLNLSSTMVSIFCTGICGITGQNWRLLGLFGSPVNNIRILTRDIQSGAPCNLLSVTGVATMQAKQETVFALINRTRKQDIWDYLQSVEDLQEIIRIQRSPHPGYEVIVFSVKVPSLNEWCLIQETYYDDASDAIIVHGWIEASSLAVVINGGDFSGIEISLCGITMVPTTVQCGLDGCIVSAGYLVKTSQTMVTSSDERVVNSMQKMVNDTLRNVENALSASLNLR